MKVSYKWLSELVDLSSLSGPDELAQILTKRGLEVEEISAQGKGFEKVVTAQILKRDPHPDADRLSLCSVSLGSGAPLEIVCGAQNMKAGDKVALAQVGALLPNGVKIQAGKIRGVLSHGMLCSETELGIKDTSEGIMILPPQTQLGLPLAQLLGLDDTLMVLKLTANRSDCLSHFGLAREISHALGAKLKIPEFKALEFKPAKEAGLPIEIKLEAGEAAPQFYGVAIDGVKLAPSPEWLKKRLESIGLRSINNVVDATNLVMMELGHPVHAYDADLIDGKVIGVRSSKKGEVLPLLDDTKVELTGEELVIFDGIKSIGLAGVMGGGNSEVRDTTTRLFLECAEFNASSVRRASSRFAKKTDAAYRFERGVDPEGLSRVTSRLATLILSLAGGRVTAAGRAVHASKQNPVPRFILLKSGFIQSFLGMNLSDFDVEQALKAQGCTVETGGNSSKMAKGTELPGDGAGLWRVTVPSYRLDLTIPEDLAEEVARHVGYDQIPATVPVLTSTPKSLEEDAAGAVVKTMDRAKDALVSAGLNETINFAFTSKSWLEKLGVPAQLKLLNPLSEELEYLAPSLLPGLVQNLLSNWHHHFGSEALSVRLFELRPTYHSAGNSGGVQEEVKAKGEMEISGLTEKFKLAALITGPRYAQAMRDQMGEVDFFDLKAVLEALFEALGTKGVRLPPLHQSRALSTGGEPSSAWLQKMFHAGQAVEILAGNQVAGVMGRMHPKLERALKCRTPVWMLELDWDVIARLSRPATETVTYKPWAEFPPMERDFAVVVGTDVPAGKLVESALKVGKPLARKAQVFDVYQGAQVGEGLQSIALRVWFYDPARNITEAETEGVVQQILAGWKKEFKADLRG